LGSRNVQRVAEGFNLPEAPRWHDGSLYFVDMYGRTVYRHTLATGATDVVHEVGGDDPSGLGFDENGDLLCVYMRSRRLMRVVDGHATEHADLSAVPATYLNDMVVDSQGRAYVDAITRQDLGEVGDDHILLVHPDGTVVPATDQIAKPNGLVITPDGGTLIAAQTPLNQLSAATIREDGTLTDVRSWGANAGTRRPDGICLDAEGAVWFGGVTSNSCVRMLPSGEITDEIVVDGRLVFACMLGGPDGKTLFLMTADTSYEEIRARAFRRQGSVEVVEVDVAGAGLP
jgi:sugar lactone lactonase YvrE